MPVANIENVKKPHASLYPADVGFRCVEVVIPDHDGYLWMLAALVSIMGNTWSWIGTPVEKQSRAQLWQTAYAMTLWDACMKCEDLQECLQPLFDALQANLIQQINSLNKYGTPDPGEPMSEDERTTDLTEGTNPTCDYDILWAQSLALVQFTNRAIEDLFEAIESATNVVELTDVIESLPLVQYVSNFVGVDFANDLVNYYQEAVQEGYLAQYTETVEIELACAVFCAARSGCAITVDLLYDIFYSRVVAIVPDNPVDALELLALLAGISITGTTVVDLMFWFAWAGAKLLSFFISNSIANLLTLQQLLNLAVNDASNDWELYCDCPELWEFVIDPVTGENMDFITLVMGTYTPGVGIATEYVDGGSGANSYTVLAFNWATIAANELTYYSVECDYTAGTFAATGDSTFFLKWGDGVIGNILAPTVPVFPETWTGSQIGGTAPSQGIGIISGASLAGGGNPGGSALLKKIKLRGYGTPPA